MTSIRALKKEKTRMDILEAAKKLFMEKGYDEVSMDEIAKLSNVGTGTIYNYYKNKGDVFIASIQESFEFEKTENISNINDLCQKINYKEYILDVINEMMNKYEWMFSRKIMKGFMKALLSIGAGKEQWFKSLTALDMKYIDYLEETFDELKKINQFRGHSRHYAELIYSAIAYEIFIYVYLDTLTMEQVKNNIQEKIKIILS